jgi:hypothetical protein
LTVFIYITAITSSIPVLIISDLPVTLVIVLGTLNIILEFFIYPANLRVVLDRVTEAFKPSDIAVVAHIPRILVLLCFAVLDVAESVGLLGCDDTPVSICMIGIRDRPRLDGMLLNTDREALLHPPTLDA